MGKQTPKLEWHVVENDTEWERQQLRLAPAAAPLTGYRLYLQKYAGNLLALLLLLVMAGAWWRTAQVEKPQRVAAATVATPHTSAVNTPGPSSVLDFIDATQGRNAMEPPTQGAREESLATPYFLYHFRQQDAAVVHAVAPSMDARYTTLWRDFGLLMNITPEKLVIHLTLEELPGQARLAFDPLTVPSPARYLAPGALSDVDLLAQSIALPLLAYGLAEAREQHQIGPAWQPLVDGLYLWQVWDLDLPLATWREPVVQWQYRDLAATRPGDALPLPDRYQNLCAAHKLWLQSPMQIHIPLLCTGSNREDEHWHTWRTAAPLTHLAQLAVPLSINGSGGTAALVGPPFLTTHPGQTVALATLIGYAVESYGREALPALVAGLGSADSWETLLPAVFGVSATEFEAGWQAYLADHYDLPLANEQR